MSSVAGQAPPSGVENGENEAGKEQRKQSPLTKELGAVRRIIETLEELPEGARQRVLTHAADYISKPQPKQQEEFDL